MNNSVILAQAAPAPAPTATPAPAPAPATNTAPAAGTPPTGNETQAVTTQPVNDVPPADQQPEGGSLFDMLLPFILIAVIFYFLIIRPQKKQQKEMQERQDSLKEGDKVITAGGLYGTIREVMQDAVRLELAPNVVIKVDKRSIAANIGKNGSPENK